MVVVVVVVAEVLFCAAWAVRVTTDAAEATVELKTATPLHTIAHPDRTDQNPDLDLSFFVTTHWLQPTCDAIGQSGTVLCRLAHSETEGNTKALQKVTDSVHLEFKTKFVELGLAKKTVGGGGAATVSAAKQCKVSAALKHLLS